MDLRWLAGKRKAAPAHTFDSFADHWLQLHSLKVTRSSSVTYSKMLELYLRPTFGGRALASITRTEVKLFVAGMVREKSKATIRLMMHVAVMVFDEAVEDGLIAGNPAAKVAGRVLPKDREDEATVKAMDKAQLARFLDTAAADEPRYYPLFLLLSRTGLRISEALALAWGDIDLESRRLTVRKSKSGRPRAVPLTTDMAEMLATMRRRGPAVFAGRFGRLPSQSAVRVAFKRIIASAKLDAYFHVHSLRHSLASILEGEGVPLDYISRILGHSDLKTTRGYAHNLPANGSALDRIVSAVPAPMPVSPKAAPQADFQAGTGAYEPVSLPDSGRSDV